MIDYLAIGLTHGLMLLAVMRMMMRDELDKEPEPVLHQQTEAEPARDRRGRRGRKAGGRRA